MQIKKTKIFLIVLLLISCILLGSCNISSGIFYTSSKDEFKGVIYGAVDIDVAKGRITIEGSDHFGYSILYPEERDVEYNLVDGTFYIKEKNKDSKLKKDPVDIKFYIDSSVGLRDLKINCISGTINVDGLVANNLDINLVSTDFNMKDSSIKEPIKFNSISADVKVENSLLTGLDFNSVAGDVKLQGNIQGGYLFETVSSNIEISTIRDKNEYNITSTSLTGTINFFDEKVYGSKEVVKMGDENAINRIKFNSLSGDIKIY